jgi:pyruvate dehydrogenase E2 component (dihydrolipoamide acetyltransferase)
VAINILMPALSPTMEEGTLAKWLVKEGDKVASGTVIAEIETDKATMEYEAADDGTVGKLVVPEGTDGVKVNDLIAIFLEEGEDATALEQPPSPTALPDANAATPSTASVAQPAEPRPTGRIFASPLARRIAAEKGLDLATISGTGPRGRIVKSDVVEAGVAVGPQATASRPDASATVAPATFDTETVRRLYADREFDEIKLDGMRRTIAARLSEAKQTIPHFYLRREIRLDALLGLRSELNRELESRDVKLSVNDFIIKASALALQQVPDCNAVWAGDRILRLKPSDVAVAVAVEGGLFTPVLRDADRKTLSALSAEMKDLATRARARKLGPNEYQGGSFAVSNLGMMGVESFDAVINPPHAAILAVGASMAKPIVGASGDIEVATMMSLTLSVDHRVIDGALGARLLQAIKQNIERPLAMLA